MPKRSQPEVVPTERPEPDLGKVKEHTIHLETALPHFNMLAIENIKEKEIGHFRGLHENIFSFSQ